MTDLHFTDQGVEVTYQGTRFLLERALIEEATGKPYPSATDADVLRMVDPDPAIPAHPRQIGDILRNSA